jgi:hypothetical protein
MVQLAFELSAQGDVITTNDERIANLKEEVDKTMDQQKREPRSFSWTST